MLVMIAAAWGTLLGRPTYTGMEGGGGGRRVESGGWRVEGGEWRVEGGEWRVESGGWRVWRVDNEGQRVKVEGNGGG